MIQNKIPDGTLLFLIENFRKIFRTPKASVFLFVFVVIFSSFKPGSNHGSTGNDEQWINLTNQSLYGSQDFLFSYGPLYWLVGGGAATPYSIYTYWLSVIFLSTVLGLFWAMLVSLLHRGASYVLPAIAFFLFLGTLNFRSALYLWPFLAVACIEFRKEYPQISTPLLTGMGVAVGLFFYIRFLYGLVGIATISSYLFCRTISKCNSREIITFSISAAASYLLIGLIVFHNPSSLIDYLIINKSLSLGNSIDMTLDVENSASTFLIVGLVVFIINTYLLIKRKQLLLTTNILLLLFFKLGFSRTDHYLNYFIAPTAILSLVMLFEKNILGRVLYTLIAMGLYYIAITPSYPGAPVKKPHMPVTDFNKDYQQRMREIYHPNYALDKSTLSIIKKSTVDFYPYYNEYAFANNLNYKHRPLFQNYMTLTPTLDQMNQRFFESNDRPEYVVWSARKSCRTGKCNTFDTFDKKYSLNEDPLTSTSILMNYHSLGVFRDRSGVPLMLLKANEKPKPYTDHVLSSEDMKFDQWYPVPEISNGVVKLIPELKFTLLGRAKNLLFRGGILKVRYKLASGDIREYRANIINSHSGIWASPYLDRFDLIGTPVKSIMLTTSSPMYFEPNFESKWVLLDLKDIKSKKLDYSKPSKSLKNIANEVSDYCDGHIDIIDNSNPSSSNIELSGVAKIHGWLAESSKNGSLMNSTYITLIDENGNRSFLSTNLRRRPDVADIFNHPSLINSGFTALVDLSDLSGSYRLGLAGIKGTTLYTCRQFTVPVTVR